MSITLTITTTNTRTEPRPTAMQKIIKTDEEWKKQLTEEQYRVTRGRGTERAFCGIFHDNHQDGIYHCVCCDLPLFESNAKFDSGTGWPSFFKPVAEENVETITDRSHGMIAHGNRLRPLRCAPRPRLRGRSAPDRPALLPQLRRAAF